ncbi:MAG: DNA-processing protein DprA, partial [bacterium]
MDRELARLYLKIAGTSGIGPATFRKMMEHFGSVRRIAEASTEELRWFLSPVVRDEMITRLESSNPDIERELDRVESYGARMIFFESTEYPELLKQINAPPPFLYSKGKELKNDEPTVAVVGTRRPTSHGKLAAEKICKELVHYGFTIVSGFAQGIDSIAHWATLDAGGKSIAVFGCGIDRIFPASNYNLYKEIIDKGTIISEFPIGTPPLAYNFPRRNRIISGMCYGTVIVEAGEKSGALITANYAIDEGREIFAVPGPMNSEKSKGVNRLIELGATPAPDAKIILETLAPILGKKPLLLMPKEEIKQEAVEEPKALLLGAISDNPVHIDELSNKLGIPVRNLLASLFELELQGVVK